MVGNNPLGLVDVLGMLSCDELILKYLNYVNSIEHPFVSRNIFPTGEDAIMAGALQTAVNGGDFYDKNWFNGIDNRYVRPVDTYGIHEYAWTAEKTEEGWRPNRARTQMHIANVEVTQNYDPPLVDPMAVYRGEMKVAHNHPPGASENPEAMSGYGLMVGKLQSPTWGGDRGEASRLEVLVERGYRIGTTNSFYMVSPTGRLYHGTLAEDGSPIIEEIKNIELRGDEFNQLICCLPAQKGK